MWSSLYKEAGGDRTNLRTRRAVEAGLQSAGIQADRPDTWGIFRYRAFMPLSDEGWQDITLGEGMTPVIRFSENVLRKMDYRILEACHTETGALPESRRVRQ
ncbi:hypothetical protein QMP26_10870 [Enterocloster clostridioformis]